MDSIIEKITLYDILGYLVPGCTFLTFVLIRVFWGADSNKMAYFKDGKGLFWGFFILAGYVSGIIISELARLLFFVLLKFLKCCGIKQNEIIEECLLKEVLIAGNVIKADNQERELFPKYFKVIYSNIQTDPAYRRIHNYASAEISCKNLSVALLLICAVYWKFSGIIGSACIVSSFILAMRSLRFMRKKREYAVLWYVQKYVKRI